jgi:gamma-glutamyltranspeptidase/glutathione hydrolase
VALNNFLNWADIDPASPAAIRGGAKASLTDISCVSPMMVWSTDGCTATRRLSHMVGTPGSYGIPQTTTQVLINLLDYHMDIQAAIEAPRCRMPELTPTNMQGTASAFVAPERAGKLVQIEARVPSEVRAELEAMGHELLVQPSWTAAVGGMQGIAVHYDTNGGMCGFSGGADPRRDGYAIGW